MRSSASSASAGSAACTCAEQYGGQGLSQTGYCRVFETIAQTDASLSVVLGVHQSIGYKGIALFGSDEQKARLPARPGRGPPAGGVRADRAGGRLGRLQPPVARGSPAGRLLDAQRREALDRQRLQGLRARHVRPRRGRRQGPPHRADRRAGHGGLRGRQALRHDGPARQRPAPPLLPRRAGAARRTCSASPARASGSPCTCSTTGGSASAPARSGPPRGCSTRRSNTSRNGASSAVRWPTSSSSRTRSAGWSPTCSASSRSRTSPPASWTRGCPTTRSSPRSARSPGPSSSGTRATAHCSSRAARATCATSPTRRSCATLGSSRSSRAPTTCCAPSSP